VRVVGPNFIAGAVVREGRVVRAAPILGYVIGWPVERVIALARRRGWTIERDEPPADADAAADRG